MIAPRLIQAKTRKVYTLYIDPHIYIHEVLSCLGDYNSWLQMSNNTNAPVATFIVIRSIEHWR